MPGNKKQQAAAAEPLQTNDLVQAQLRKTALCKFHMAGCCRMGTKCNFAHNASEIRDGPNLNKTSLCTTFMTGQRCKNSAQCPFAHGKRELRATTMFQANRSNKKAPGNSNQNDDPGLENTPSESRPVSAELIMTPGPMFQARREEEPSHPYREQDEGEYQQMPHRVGRVPPQGTSPLSASEENNNMVPPSRGNDVRLSNAEFVMEFRRKHGSPINGAEVLDERLMIPISMFYHGVDLTPYQRLAVASALTNSAPDIYQD